MKIIKKIIRKILFRIFKNKIVVLEASMDISEKLLIRIPSSTDFKNMVTMEIEKSMAHKIFENPEVCLLREERDLLRNTRKIRARIWLLKQ